MALTAATKPANQEGGVHLYTGGLGASDNNVLLEVDGRAYDEYIISHILGASDVFVSVDGTNFNTTASALEDLNATAPATRVVVTATQRSYLLKGTFAKVRFLQAGGTAPTEFSVAARLRRV